MNALQKSSVDWAPKEKIVVPGYGCTAGYRIDWNSFGFGVWPKPISFRKRKTGPFFFIGPGTCGIWMDSVRKDWHMACFCTLASGSSGNSTYIGSGVSGVLIDVGISCRGILTALETKGIDRESIGAVFITHEHIDHIKGLKVLLKKLPVPVYATDEVLDFLAGRDYLPADAKAIPMPVQGVGVGDLYIGAFETSHDSAHSVGYVAVSGNGKKMAVSTDLGVVTPMVREAVSGCDLVLLESNYDRNMLMAGCYPYPLKRPDRRGFRALVQLRLRCFPAGTGAFRCPADCAGAFEP